MSFTQVTVLFGLLTASVCFPAHAGSYESALKFEKQQVELQQKKAELERYKAETQLLKARSKTQECNERQSATAEPTRLVHESVDDEGQTHLSNVGRRAIPPKPEIWNTIARQCPSVRDLNDVVWCVNKMKAEIL